MIQENYPLIMSLIFFFAAREAGMRIHADGKADGRTDKEIRTSILRHVGPRVAILMAVFVPTVLALENPLNPRLLYLLPIATALLLVVEESLRKRHLATKERQ